MLGKPLGVVLLSAALLTAGLAGLAALWAAWPRTSGTSPLAAILASVWSGTYLGAAVLTWRGSRLAGLAFVAATGLLLPLMRFIFPGGEVIVLPAFVGIALMAFFGYRYLRETSNLEISTTGRI